MLRPITGCGPFGLMKSSVVEKFGKSDFEVDSATSARILSLSVTCHSLPRSNTRLLVTRAPVSLDVRIFGRSEEQTSELQSLMRISYAVFCLKKKTIENRYQQET